MLETLGASPDILLIWLFARVPHHSCVTPQAGNVRLSSPELGAILARGRTEAAGCRASGQKDG